MPELKEVEPLAAHCSTQVWGNRETGHVVWSEVHWVLASSIADVDDEAIMAERRRRLVRLPTEPDTVEKRWMLNVVTGIALDPGSGHEYVATGTEMLVMVPDETGTTAPRYAPKMAAYLTRVDPKDWTAYEGITLTGWGSAGREAAEKIAVAKGIEEPLPMYMQKKSTAGWTPGPESPRPHNLIGVQMRIDEAKAEAHPAAEVKSDQSVRGNGKRR